MYESAQASSRSLTPGFGSKTKDSLSMQKILQPYLALDLIRDTKEGLVANEAALKQRLARTPIQAKSDGLRARPLGNLRLEAGELAKEEGLFRGLGANHDRSMRQACESSKADSFIMWNQAASSAGLKQFQPVLKERQVSSTKH